MAICPNCKREVPDNMTFCGFCGSVIPNGQTPATAPYTPPQGYSAPVARATNGGSPAKSIVGMIFSIIGISLAIVGTGLLADLMNSVSNIAKLMRYSDDDIIAPMVLLSFGFCFALPGLIVSCKGRRNARGRKMGTVGMILGIIGIALSVGTLTVFGIIIGANS